MIRKKAGGADEPASLFAVMYHEERKENRMITLPQRFKERMKELLGEEYSAFEASYEQEKVQGLRFNSLKTKEGRKGSKVSGRKDIPGLTDGTDTGLMGKRRVLLSIGGKTRKTSFPRSRSLLYPGTKCYGRSGTFRSEAR